MRRQVVYLWGTPIRVVGHWSYTCQESPLIYALILSKTHVLTENRRNSYNGETKLQTADLRKIAPAFLVRMRIGCVENADQLF